MKSGSNPSPRDDDFTSAAESLLGIDLSSSGLSGEPIDLDDADLFGEPEAVQPQAVETSPPSAVDETQDFRGASSAGRLMDDEDDFGSDFGTGIVADEPSPPSAERRPAARPPERPAPRSEDRPARRSKEQATEPPAERRPVSEEPPPATAPAARKDDAYWDALEGWDWNEEAGGAGKSASREDAPPARGRSGGERSRGRGGERPSRRSAQPKSERPADRPPSSSQERPRSRPQPPALDEDFGSGLEDASPRRGSEPAPDASIFSLHPTESQARYLDEPDEDVGPDVSTFGLNPSESQARDLRERDDTFQRRGRGPAPRAVDLESDDQFGAGLDEESSSRRDDRPEPPGSESGRESSESEQRRGRRRGRGRGRGQGAPDRGRGEHSRPPAESRREEGRRDEPEERDDLSYEESFIEPPPREVSVIEPELQEARFQDVPTWAEAISLLVKHRPRTSTSGSVDRGRSESSESGDRGERGERSRGGGRGRGRGRRGGGGGRRSD